jgi:hypothetical protein
MVPPEEFSASASQDEPSPASPDAPTALTALQLAGDDRLARALDDAIASASGLAVAGRAERAPLRLRAALVRRGRLAMLGGLLLVVAGAGAAGLPALAGCALGVGAVSYSAMVIRDVFRADLARLLYGPLGPPLRPEVRPSDLGPQEIHAAYVEILRAHEDVRVALARSPGILEPLRDTYERVSELVQAAGRVGRRGNSLQAYLRRFCPDAIESDAASLENKMAETGDEQAALAFRQAARARRQQLELYRQIEGLYDRVKARLALVASFLGAVGALVVKLHVLDLEQIEAAGSSISDHLDLLRSDLELLETSLEGALSS